jgi:hypothetical protein
MITQKSLSELEELLQMDNRQQKDHAADVMAYAFGQRKDLDMVLMKAIE